MFLETDGNFCSTEWSPVPWVLQFSHYRGLGTTQTIGVLPSVIVKSQNLVSLIYERKVQKFSVTICRQVPPWADTSLLYDKNTYIFNL